LWMYARSCIVISTADERRRLRRKRNLDPCGLALRLSCCDPQPNLLFVFAAPHHFASLPNQSQAWRMHVKARILVLFLRRADPPTSRRRRPTEPVVPRTGRWGEP
jgi:hypothetical protein